MVAMALAKEGAISSSRSFGACPALIIAAAYGMIPALNAGSLLPNAHLGRFRPADNLSYVDGYRPQGLFR
jgi:hypothetical protein